MTALLASSTFIVVAVVPIALLISTMAGFAIGHLRIPGSRVLLAIRVWVNTPLWGNHCPALLSGTRHRTL
jgi:raffinose/stachyose/melibiose transport system permease protein